MYVIAEPELGSKVRLKFHVEQRRVDQAYQRLYDSLSDRGDIPGFRKGKVPPWRIRRQYGDEAVDGVVFGELIEEAFRSLLLCGDIKPVEIAEFGEDDKRQAKPGQPLEADAVVRVRPDTRIPEFSSIEVKVPDTEPTEEQIEEQLRELQDAAADVVQVEDREVREGDLVEVKLRAKVEGEEEEEERDEAFIVGEDRYDPALDRNLLGHKIGETVEFTVEYPDKLTMGDLAGKSVEMAATISVISERHVPEIDDEFAAQAAEASSVGELREKVAEQVRQRNQELAGRVLRNGAARWLVDNIRVDLPASIRERSADIEDELPKEMDDIDAAEVVKLSLACDTVLADRGISVGEADIMQEYVRAGVAQGLTPEDLMSDEIHDEIFPVLRDRVVRRKALEIVAEAATAKRVPLSQFLEDAEADRSEAGEETQEEPQEVDEGEPGGAGAPTEEQENEQSD